MNSGLGMFMRMVWKEYRSLRMLWIGCGLGTIALFAIVLGLANNRQGMIENVSVLWSLGLWVPAIYLLGCAVASFAGEREERTADWLIGLAAPTGSTITAKFLWTFVSALVLQLALFGVVLGIQNGLIGGGSNHVFPYAEMLSDIPVVASWTLVEALAWGLFWSLQSSRPMNAVAGSALSIVVVNILAGWVGGVTPWGSTIQAGSNWWAWAFTPWGWLRAPLTFGLLILDVALARQWLAGRPWDWSATIDGVLSRWKRRAVTGRLEPTLPWRRAWQRLFWLELQTIKFFLLATAGVTLLGLIPIVFWPEGGPALPCLAAALLPLFAGLSAWSGEQTRQQFRFLTNQGVTPTAVWLNKASIWLAALSVAAAILIGVSLLTWMIGTQFDPKVWKPIFPLRRLFPHPENNFALFCGIGFWYGTITFAGALTVGVYFRRAMIAFGMGLLLTIALWVWVIVAAEMQIPLWVFLGSVFLWLLWCSLRQTSRWMIERTGWRLRGVIAAEWLIAPLVIVSSGIAYWVYTVPSPNVAALRADVISKQFNNPNARTEWQAAFVAARELPNLVAAKIVTEPLEETPSSMSMGLAPLPQTMTEADWETAAADVKVLCDLLLKPVSLPMEPKSLPILNRPGKTLATSPAWMALQPEQLQQILKLLMGRAERELAAGHIDESLLFVRAAVRYVGVLWCDTPLTFGASASDSHGVLHRELIAWASHPAQTQATLVQALNVLEQQELRWWITDASAIFNTYDYYLDTIDYQREHYYVFWSSPPWWYAREKRILATELSNRLDALQRLPRGHRTVSFTERYSIRDIEPAWEYRGMGRSRWPATHGPLGLEQQTLAAIWDRETRIRCTFAAMAAAGYQREHGHMPRSLHDVIPEFASETLLQDPWSYGLLQLEPDGVGKELPDAHFAGQGERPTIPEHTPFVWSLGAEQAQLIEQANNSQPYLVLATNAYPNGYGRMQPGAIGGLTYAFAVVMPSPQKEQSEPPISAEEQLDNR